MPLQPAVGVQKRLTRRSVGATRRYRRYHLLRS